MPHPQFKTIRDRFERRCGYCGVSEITVGGELTIDHYRPQAADGNDDQDNLIYACVRCNQYKGCFWPDDHDLDHDRRVLHPVLDDTAAHIGVDEDTGRLYGVTPTGAFHISLLRLNRPQLVAHRLAFRLQTVLQEKVHLLQQQNAELRKTISAQERYLDLLSAQSRQRRTPE